MMEETSIPIINNRLTLSHWQLSHMPGAGFEHGQLWEIQANNIV